MKKVFTSITVILMAITVLSSCKKADTTQVADNFDNFIATQQSPVQTFTVNASTGGLINCTGGTKITFPANWAVNADGTAFTGDAVITVQESIKKSQWMMDGLSTATQGDMLVTGGMLNLVAKRKDNGAELKPAPAMQVSNPNLAAVIKAEVPRNKDVQRDLLLFLPDTTNGNPTVPETKPPTGWYASNYYPFGNGVNSYIFQLPKFHWVNCDGLANQPGTKTTIKVTPNMSAFGGATAIQVMLVYRTINTVITLPPKTGYFESYTNSIPVGSVADVVLIGKAANGGILFKVLSANTFTALQNISITPASATAADVMAYLNSVN